jgi:hypothetical protein
MPKAGRGSRLPLRARARSPCCLRSSAGRHLSVLVWWPSVLDCEEWWVGTWLEKTSYLSIWEPELRRGLLMLLVQVFLGLRGGVAPLKPWC